MVMDYLVLILITAALTALVVLWRTSRVFARPIDDLFGDLFRLDLDRLPVTDRSMNRAYQKMMRESGQKGPAGHKQPMKHMVVLTPAEDFAYIRSFGMYDFEQQLLSYLRTHITNSVDWHMSDSEEPTTVQFKLDDTRKRLRPKLAKPASGVTSVLLPDPLEQVTRPVTPDPPEAAAPDSATPRRTVLADPQQAFASFSYNGIVTTLSKTDRALTVGRTEDNDVVVEHDNFSARHLIVWSENGDWNVKPAPDTLNATFLNGKLLLERAVLKRGDEIKVGGSKPLIFNI